MDEQYLATAAAAGAAALCYCTQAASVPSDVADAPDVPDEHESTSTAAIFTPDTDEVSVLPPADESANRRLVVVGTGAERKQDDPHSWIGLSSILLFSIGRDGSLKQEFEHPDVGVNPMFICPADCGRVLYAVNMGTKQNAATLQTYAVDHGSRTLSKIGETPTADGPCHISTTTVDGRDVFGAPQKSQLVFVASYGAGTVGVHVARPDGTLGPAACTVIHGVGASTTVPIACSVYN